MGVLQFLRNHPRTVRITLITTTFVIIAIAIAVTITQATKKNVESSDTTITPTESPDGQDRSPQTASSTPTPSYSSSVSQSLPSQTPKEVTETQSVVSETPTVTKAETQTGTVTATETPTPSVTGTKTPVVVTPTTSATAYVTPTPSLSNSKLPPSRSTIPQAPTESTSPVPSYPDTHGSGCSIVSQCSFVDNFKRYDKSRWTASDNYANGGPFGAWWDKSKVEFISGTGLKLHLSPEPALKADFASGQLQSNGWFEYGCFEASIKPVSKSGYVNSHLFTSWALLKVNCIMFSNL